MPAPARGLWWGAAGLWYFPAQLWALGPQTWDSTEDRPRSQTRCGGNGWDRALLHAKLRVPPGCGGHGGLGALLGRRRGGGNHPETKMAGRKGGESLVPGPGDISLRSQPSLPAPCLAPTASCSLDGAEHVRGSLLCAQCPWGPGWCGSNVEMGLGGAGPGHASSPTPPG